MLIYNNVDYTRLFHPLPKFVKRDIFDIPVINPEAIDISHLRNDLFLCNLKNAKTTDELAKQRIVHSFCYDDTLLSAFKNPFNYLIKVCRYYAVTSFDFSMHKDMDLFQIIQATYCNRWIGAYLQSYGISVIPTVGWVTPNTYDICFAGLRDNGVFIISTLSTCNIECHDMYLAGYHELRTRFPFAKIICYGNMVKGMDHDVYYVKYKEAFVHRNNTYQPALFNYDGSIPEEVKANVI